MIIRKYNDNDFDKLIGLLNKAHDETTFLLNELDELKFDRELLRALNLIVIEEDDQFSGYIMGKQDSLRRRSHILRIAMAVLREHWGKNYGELLLNALEEQIGNQNIKKFELTVRTDNYKAISLYLRKGFIVEGKRLNSLKIDGTYFSEYYMGKALT